MKKNRLHTFEIILIILLYLIFAVIWVYIAKTAYSAFHFSSLTCYEDIFGRWSVWLGVSIAVAAFLSPFYLRRFFKKELYISILAILMSVLFIMTVSVSYQFTTMLFSDFTPLKWEQYPRQRVTMLEDLKKNHKIIGCSSKDVISLLGKPDKINDHGFYIYGYESGYIQIQFKNGKVISLEATDFAEDKRKL